MNYTINDKAYAMNYQELKETFERYSEMTDEAFRVCLPNIIHFACFVSWFKRLSPDQTISDVGIIHQLVHLLTSNDPIVDIKEVRADFDRL